MCAERSAPMLSLSRCRALLPSNVNPTDEELDALRSQMQALAEFVLLEAFSEDRDTSNDVRCDEES